MQLNLARERGKSTVYNLTSFQPPWRKVSYKDLNLAYWLQFLENLRFVGAHFLQGLGNPVTEAAAFRQLVAISGKFAISRRAFGVGLRRSLIDHGIKRRRRKCQTYFIEIMEVHQNPGELITMHLLARENQYTEVRDQLNSAVGGDEIHGGYVSSFTGVLVFSSFVAVCGSLNYGLAVGYSSPVESEIIDDLGLSTAEALTTTKALEYVKYSLFGSFLTIGGALGAIACGKMSDYLGRRGTFGVTDILSIVGWLAIVASEGVLPLYLGRVLLGFALGLSAYAVPVYVAEITPKDLRGGFVTLHMLIVCTGISTSYILGVFISWRILAVIGIIPNLSQLIGLFFIPESPRWLVKVHKENEFKIALQRLRGSNANISREAADIKEYTEALQQTSKVSIFELFQKKYTYSLTVGIGLFALSQLIGTNGIIYYASSIFESAGFSSKLGSILMAIVQVPSALISLLLMDRFGRRPLLMVSASGLCLACLLPGISFVLQDHDWLKGFSPYLALIGLLMFSAFYAVGMGGISFLMISEIYPMNIKGLAGSVATLAGWGTSWVVAYAFNFSMEWSSAGTFFILTGICAFTILFVVMVVPETKGRTLEEIQASINQKFRIGHENEP